MSIPTDEQLIYNNTKIILSWDPFDKLRWHVSIWTRYGDFITATKFKTKEEAIKGAKDIIVMKFGRK